MKYKKISIIGLGFIGLPLFVYLNSKLNNQIIGIDKKSLSTEDKFLKLRKGINPIKSNDEIFDKLVKKISKKKLSLSTNINDIKKTQVVVVSIGFDLTKRNPINNLKKLFKQIGEVIEENTLIIFETTVLPGTSENVILPILKKEVEKRDLDFGKIYFSYSFERIMPGKNYIKSLNSNRCYSSKDSKSKKETLSFLKLFIDTKKNKLDYFDNFIDCETTKIIENSYRALNIAFIDEWVRFGDENNLDTNKILSVIRRRKTHSNIMRPGIGVGGYCLTKDLLFGNLSNIYFRKKKIDFPLTLKAKLINQNMFKTSLDFIKKNVNIKNKRILILGVSYKEDVFDLRLSPSMDLVKSLMKYTKKVFLYDPFLEITNNSKFLNKIPSFKNFDIIIFSNAHEQIKNISFKQFARKAYYFDLNNVLSFKMISKFRENKIILKVLGDKE